MQRCLSHVNPANASFTGFLSPFHSVHTVSLEMALYAERECEECREYNMDIYNYLKRDHRRVSEMMAQMLVLRSPENRLDLFREIKHEILIHAETEQATFYAALANRKSTEERIAEAREEHEEIKSYLGRLSAFPVESRPWLEMFGEFRHAVMHHIQEEEEIIFEKAKRILSHPQAVQLARDMVALKQLQYPQAA
jgi:hypothetical protein